MKPDDLARRYTAVRSATLALAAPLSEADCQAQSMADASPVKWHLAHTTWFFETFVLERFEPGFTPHHGAYRVLFNSYYQAVGEQHARPQRGLITRPGASEIRAYRAAVDERVLRLLGGGLTAELADLVTLGLQHEQQHQELILTDLLHLLSCNPMAPVYTPWPPLPAVPTRAPVSLDFLSQAGGLVETGYAGSGFAFDNETPRHRLWLEPYALANRLVNNEEWLAFMASGGYVQPRWWLSTGWDWVRTQRVQAPLHWRQVDGAWQAFSLHGLAPLNPQAPVVHVSLYEADAFAAWMAAQTGQPLRLPTEAEWEHAAAPAAAAAIAQGSFIESGLLQPPPAPGGAGLQQLFGELWQWTRSAYSPYPGFRPWGGAVGEYNGKFMANQFVLRGGSVATPRAHIRASYRNFFPADARWQFMGLRLARDGG
jgi:ergothioneine biosynthesis protein EgtB